MFANIVALAAGVLIACGSCTRNPIPDAPHTLDRPSVAKLQVYDETGDEDGTCTVWKASDTMAVTAGHCCDKGQTYQFIGEAAIPGERIDVLLDDDKHDICVFRAKMRGPSLHLAVRDPAVGSKVWTAGYPHGFFMIGEGYWSGRDDKGRGSYSIDAAGGFSGSPVMTPDHHVICMLNSGYLGHSVTFGTNLDQIRSALHRASLVKLDEEPIGELKPGTED
jgi:hypothetical protein